MVQDADADDGDRKSSVESSKKRRRFSVVTGTDSEFPVILDPVKPNLQEDEVEILYPQQTYGTPLKRFQWSNMEYSICTLSVAANVSNILKFPYLCYKHGGSAFLIPYLLMLVLTVVPCFYMESIIGQYSREGTISAWKMCPLFKGIGWSMLLINFFSLCYNQVFLSWALVYLRDAVSAWDAPDKSKWARCDMKWSSPNCRDSLGQRNFIGVNTTIGVYAAQEYFRGRVLGQWGDRAVPKYDLTHGFIGGAFVIDHVVQIAIVFGLVGLLMLIGTKFASRMAWLGCTLGVVGMFMICFRGVTLPGSGDGMLEFLKPNFSKLLEIRTWEEATKLSFHSPGVGYGIHLTFASFNHFGRGILTTVVVTAVADVVLSLTMGLSIFAYIGFLAERNRAPVSSMVQVVPEMVFEVFPDVLGNHPTANFYIFVMFATIVLMGLTHKISSTVNIITGISDEFRPFFRNHWWARPMLIIVVTLLAYAATTASLTRRASIFVVAIYDKNIEGISQLFVILLQVVVLGWIFGVQGLSDCVEAMSGYPPNYFFRFCWKVTAPLGVLLILISTIVRAKDVPKFRGQEVTLKGYLFGLGLSTLPALFVPCFVVYQIIMFRKKAPNSRLKWLLLISPEHEHNDILEANRGRRQYLYHYRSFGGDPMTVYFDEFETGDATDDQDYILPNSVIQNFQSEMNVNQVLRAEYQEEFAHSHFIPSPRPSKATGKNKKKSIAERPKMHLHHHHELKRKVQSGNVQGGEAAKKQGRSASYQRKKKERQARHEVEELLRSAKEAGSKKTVKKAGSKASKTGTTKNKPQSFMSKWF